MRIRTLAISAIAVGASAFAAAPAPAATTTVNLLDVGGLFGGTSITRPDDPAVGKVAQTLTQTATGQNVGGTLSQTNILVECAAASTPGVATGITSCYLEGENGAIYQVPRTGAKPGAADAAASAVVLVPLQDYKACISSQALMQDNTYLTAPVRCFG
jgi:hypothetical protein